MDHYVGLNVSVRATSVCVVEKTGNPLKEAKVPTEPEAIASVFAKGGYACKRVGLEAGPMSQWLYGELAAAGLPAICVEAQQMRSALAAQRNITDRNDARGIAHSVRDLLYRERAHRRAPGNPATQEVQMADHLGIHGLHHVTAIASGAQANLDFYTRVLGLRLVKRTVNFDAPDTYHFYYGDIAGSPGSLLTFFPFGDAAAGRAGTGMAETTAFAIPEVAFEPWMSRFAEEGRDFDGPLTRFGAQVLGLRDPDGLGIELVAEPGLDGSAPDASQHVTRAAVPHAIRRLHSVALCVEAPERTARLLNGTFGYETVGEEAGRQRFRAPGVGSAGIVDLLCQPDRMRGRMGAGTVHHVAFRAHDEAEQLTWREALLSLGFDVTPVLDRQYFRSIYFREPGGVLFEIATDPPGFATDETPEALGTALKLPPWLEPQRAAIERRLPPLRLGGSEAT